MTKSIGELTYYKATNWRIFPTFILLLNCTKNTEEKKTKKRNNIYVKNYPSE